MRYIYRALAMLVMLGALVLVGYAYIGNLNPVQHQVEQPVKLNVD